MAVIVKVCPVSPMPSLMPVRLTVCNPEFAGIANVLLALLEELMLVIGSSVGALLTVPVETLTVNICWTKLTPGVPPLSVTVTVMFAVPGWSATGVKVSEPVVLGLV